MGTHHDGTPREKRALDAYIKLARCLTTVDGRLAAGLGEHGLTTAQFGVLEALHHLGELGQGELCQKVLRTGGSMTSMIDNLARKGLVERRRSQTDRRVVKVRLTAAGRKQIAEVFPEHLERLVRSFSVLSAREQEELGRLCRKLGLGAT